MQTLKEQVREIERLLIKEALIIHRNNKQAAANHLGIGRTTLIMKMKVLGLPVNRPTREK